MSAASGHRARLFENREFTTYSLETPPAAFGPFAAFVELWRDRWRAGRLPAWRDFDFPDFKGWHGMILVDELVSTAPFEMRCRLWGSQLTELLGIDETGKLLSESPAAEEPGLIDFYRSIVVERRIGLSVGRVWSYQRPIEFSVVKLPCASDGENVDIILSAAKEDFTLTVERLGRSDAGFSPQ